MGLITILETQEQAMALSVSNSMQEDMLENSAIVPRMAAQNRIVEPRDVKKLRLRMVGVDLSSADVQGSGQTVDGEFVELIDPRDVKPGPTPADLDRYLRPEPFIESDAPEIKAEAERMVAGITGTRARAERLTREVNTMVEKKPTVSLPSALEVLRTKVGDCNEHTALFVGAGAIAGHSGAHQRRPRLRARRVLLPRVARGLHRRRQGAGVCGCPSIRRSINSRPMRRTSASRAAASTSRRRSCRCSARRRCM
jgi:hypothetical protein